MARFKVIVERVETITKQGAVMVEASTAEEAREIIRADLDIDPGSYDDNLEPVETWHWGHNGSSVATHFYSQYRL
jgi:hypothetical protein